MPSTIAMFTGLTGLKANSRTIDVVGNNIANVNTTAYKSARLNFADLAPWTIRPGSPPAAESGGSNPYQVGLGVRATTTQRNFNSGTIAPTGDPHDLALEGDGFFQVVRDGKTTFTRAGNFRPDANQVMTTPTGERLQGYGVDSNFNIATGTLTDVRIPIGQMSIAQPTTMVTFKGNLNANGALPTTGSVTNLSGTAALGLRTIAGATPSPTGTNLLETTTRLIDIEDPALPASNTPMFAAGQTIQVRGAEKGNKQVPTAALDITSATTIADLNDFLTTTLGIDTTIGNNPDGRTPGVALDPATGILTVIGNAGSVNDLNLASSNVRLLDSAGVSLRQPFVSARSATADGESVRTTFVAYDSLGTPLTLDVSASLVSRTSTGTTWRYSVESADDSDASLLVATGVLNFDTEGRLTVRQAIPIQVDRANTGADSPLSIDLFFGQGADNVTSLTDDHSALAAANRDGSPLGTLSGFGIGPDGIIVGAFTNGLTRNLGQVVVATFTNNEGLLDEGGNMFSTGANSGTAQITTAGTLGAGLISGGALEQSNVDLSDEFIKMITASTGYSASSRVIKTTDELFQQLLVLGR